MQHIRYLAILSCIFFLAAQLHLAEAQVTVSGMLLGSEGNPMQTGHLVVKDGPIDTSLVAVADSGGYFSFTLSEPGGYGIYAMGVYHDVMEIPLILTSTEPVEMHIQLAPSLTIETPDSVWLVTPSHRDTLLMQRHEDGAHTARVAAPGDTLAYMVLGIKTTPWGGDVPAPGHAS